MRISDWSSDVCSSDLKLRQTHLFLLAAIGRDLGVHLLHRFRIGLERNRRDGVYALGLSGHGGRIQHPLRVGGHRPRPGSAGKGYGKERKSRVEGKRVSVRVTLGGRRIINKKIT